LKGTIGGLSDERSPEKKGGEELEEEREVKEEEIMRRKTP